MKRIVRHMCIIMTVLLLGTAVYAELKLMEDFEAITTIDGANATGVMGGFWDTESEGTGNVVVETSGGSRVVRFMTTSGTGSVSGRGVAFAGINNPIDDTETGVVFFRFMLRTDSQKPRSYIGLHSLTGTNPLTGTQNNAPANYIAAGFAAMDNGAGGYDLKTTNGSTVLKAGMVRNQWYNCWIVANNSADTFDLYISTATAPAGAATLPNPGDQIGENLPFGAPTTAPLTGVMFCCPAATDGQSTRTYIDEIYWDGDQGLSSMMAQKPDPAKGAVNVAPSKVLSWTAPDSPAIAEVISYDVYLDPNNTKVTNRDPSTRKSEAQSGNSFDPTPDLEFATTYYWCVDSWVTLAADPNTPKQQVRQAGTLWSFTTKGPAPEITAEPANVLVAAGKSASFTVGVLSPYATATFQWYTSADPVNNTAADDKLIDGATSDTYTIPIVSLTDETYYYCKVSNVYHNIPNDTYSDTAALGVKRQVAHWTLDALVDGKYQDSAEGHNAQPGGIPVFVDGVNPSLTGSGVVVDSTNGWAQFGGWDPSQYSGQLTISAWVKWNGQPATPVYQGLLGKRTVFATNMRWQLEIANNAASLLSFKSNINGITGPILPVGVWTQVVITYDGTTATMYRNGTYSVSGPVTLGNGSDANLMIGAVGLDPALTAPTSILNGTLDDVRIYNYALDPVTVAYSFTDITGGIACANPRNPILVAYDLNGDCAIGLADMADWASHWLGGQLVPDVVSRP